MVRALLTPRMLALHALAVVATAGAVLLGLWQLDAWRAGRELEVRDLAGASPRPLTDVMTADAPFPGEHVGRPVTLQGTWVSASTLLVTDRRLGGRTGVWAVTPVAVCAEASDVGRCSGDEPAMLVVRGWAATRDAVPPPPEGTVRLTGWLQPGEGTGAPDADPGDDVLPELRIASAIQHVDQDLYGGYVIARSGGPDEPLEPVTPESLPEPSSFTSLQNLLYAIQWWLFGGFALYIWQRWVRDELARGDESAPPGVGGEDTDERADATEIASTS